MIRQSTATLALLLACASAFAQDGATKAAQLSFGAIDASFELRFHASLLLIKSNWTQSPAAKEIDADWRKAWGQDHPNLKLLDKDSKASPGLLFSTAAASIYTQEQYAQLLAWLKARQLVVANEPFLSTAGDPLHPPNAASLQKDCEFFGIEKPSWPPNEPFFTRTREFTWSIRAIRTGGSPPQFSGFHITRELVDFEKGRGQDQPLRADPNAFDRCDFGVSPLADGHVLIVHAFPEQDFEFLNAAHFKGFVPLIVVERLQSLSKVDAEPKLLLPDKVQRIYAERTRGARSGSRSPASPPPTVAAGSSVENEQVLSQIKVFSLRHAKASDAERLIAQLFPRDIQSVAADQRTNSVIVRGTPENLNIIYAILTRLDQLESDSASPNKDAAKQGAPKALPVAELTKQYQAKEQEAAGLARQIRELQSAPEAHKQPIEEMTASLRRAVADAFAARQRLHQAEAAQLQQRVAGIQHDLQIRQQVSDKIIDRRVQDLLNPGLQWETGSRPASGTSATGSPPPGGSTSGTAAASNLPAAREYRDKLLERWQSIERLYEGGKYGLEDLLRSASDLGEAEFAVTYGQGERRAAREKHVSRLKAIKSVVDAKFKAGLEPEYHKLAIDAELLKAEGLLASESAESSTSNTRPARPRPNQGNSAASRPGIQFPSTLNPAANGELSTIRSADDFRRRLASLQASIARTKVSSLSGFAGDNETERAATRQAVIDNAERDLAFLREEYAAQLRLLELERQHAHLARQSAAQQRGVARKRFDSGQETSDSVLSHEQAIQEAQHRIDRADTLLELYRKADPKNAPSQQSSERDSALQKAAP